MHIFKDSTGREWPVEINAATLKRVWDLAKIDLGSPDDTAPGDTAQLFVRLRTGSALLCAILPAICFTRINQLGLTIDQFLEALGDKIGEAREAFWSEWQDFFRRTGEPEKAQMLSAFGKYRDLAAQRQTKGGVLSEVERLLDGECRLGSPAAGGSAGSSASTPEDSPSAS